MSRQLADTVGLVLRKTPFSETSLIFACLTRDEGQQHFLLRGALKQEKKKFPAADLFRRLHIVYCPAGPESDLHTAREVDCERAFDSAARVPAHFRAAAWICKFLLRNTVPNEPVPRLFDAANAAFARLAQPETCVPAVILGLCFTALADSGLLPALPPDSHQARELQRLLLFAVDEAVSPPDYAADAWQGLGQWTRDFLRTHDLYVPEGWDRFGLA